MVSLSLWLYSQKNSMLCTVLIRDYRGQHWKGTQNTIYEYKNVTACRKNVNNCWNTNMYSYFETSGGKFVIYILMLYIFSMPVLIRHLQQLKTVVFLHWCLMHTVLLVKVYLSSRGTSGENSCCTSSNKE